MKIEIVAKNFPVSFKFKKIGILKWGMIIAVIFLYLFFPPLTRLGMLYFVAAGAYCYAAFHLKSFIKFLTQRYILVLSGLWCGMLVYLLVTAGIHHMPLAGILRDYIYLLFMCIPGCYLIFSLIKSRCYDLDNIENVLIIVGNVQGAFAVLSMISPGFHNWVLQRLINYGFDSERYIGLANYRLYGFAFHMTNYMPMVLAMLAVLTIRKSQKNRKYLCFLPLLVLGVVLNSRSSIILMGAGVFLIIVFSVKKPKLFLEISGLCLVGMLLAIIAIKYLIMDSDSWYSGWMRSGIEQLLDLKEGNKTHYFKYISNDNVWALPKGINFFFGYGCNNPKLIDSVSSDIGFVNYFRLGGLIYCVAVIASFFWLINPLRKKNKFLYIFFLISFFLMNVKDTLFTANEYICFILLYCVLYEENRKLEKFKILKRIGIWR